MEKENSKKGIFKSTANIIFWIVLVIVAIYSALALFSRDQGIMKLFGIEGMTVQSDSMATTFEKGDLIFINTNYNLADIKAKSNTEAGDVITYQAQIDLNGDGNFTTEYISHRVIAVTQTQTANGIEYFFTVEGDNPAATQQDVINQDFVVGMWNGHKIANLGGILDGIKGFLKSGTGFFIFIVLPCFAFLVYEGYKFVGVMSEYKVQKITEERVKSQEAAVAIAKAQLEEEAKQTEKLKKGSKEEVKQ